MKLYFYPTCPISNAIRILTAHLPNISQEEISNRVSFVNLKSESLPLLIVKQDKYYGLWPILIYLKNNNSKSMIDELFSCSDQLNFIHHIQNMYNDIYFDFIAERTLYNIYYKSTNANISFTPAVAKLTNYIKKYTELLGTKSFLFGNSSCACDIILFGMMATCEYFGIIDWKNYNILFEWYLRCKSIKQYNFILESSLIDMPTTSIFYNIDL